MDAKVKEAKEKELNTLKVKAYDIGTQLSDLQQSGLLINNEITKLTLELRGAK